jgi:hypothetical protein
MRWTLACVGALLFLAACSGDEGAPGPGGTGSSTSSSSGDAGAGANASVGCNADGDCQSGHCFLGNNQHFCTVPCTAENATTVCIAPFTGTCNKQGFCKRD